ncbi:MAG: DNA polymerase III subunit beta [Lachnospiraceae bacterium]|nr:DNA polymerase III subunit beta [Lachnospiraceae bacterium]
MKIICSKSNLSAGVNIALKAIPARTTMPILECIILKVTNAEIELISNDMEIGIETKVDGMILETGTVALDAKVFSEIVRKLPDADVEITVDENYRVSISCEKAHFNLLGRSAEEFPGLPAVEKDRQIVLSQFTLKELIRQTVFSISDNESNRIMSGELFEISGDSLRVVSLDGHRISIRRTQLKNEYPDAKVIVPGKTLSEISKILSGEADKDVVISFTGKHILFEMEDTLVVSRLIEGDYYKIDQMLSSDYETKMTVNKRELLSCIDRASLLIRESEKKPIILTIQPTGLELKINTMIGSMKEDIDIEMEGRDIMIGFNPKFLMDALRVIDDETVDIYLFNPKAPCFIKDKDETYIYLILPVNISAAN